MTALKLVRLLPQRLVDAVGQRHAVDVAEHHRAGQPERRHRALELGAPTPPGSFSGKRRERQEVLALLHRRGRTRR